ncbi:hypothetical protein RCH09_003503 [Actimicrobium sp. GrIS 1.19]|uniref:Imm21 family immunity protein n=1 Tax=Actimicrobium sp. GrIS 1.19 TaxID=3071708 RepID=UPI002DFF6E91|nr:hypothetical protein [Actimicrobium sp. GrIS 1.19]
MRTHWINSNGGPYILANNHAASRWQATKGISSDNDNGYANDYQRACAINGYAGVIQSDSGSILSIDDLPRDLAVYLNTDTEAVLVKLVGAESDKKIWAALDAEIEFPFKELDFEFEITESELVIFDSSELFSDVGQNKLFLKLSRGVYSVEVLNYEPHDQLMLQLFRLRRVLSNTTP